jgi:hypothetical protein
MNRIPDKSRIPTPRNFFPGDPVVVFSEEKRHDEAHLQIAGTLLQPTRLTTAAFAAQSRGERHFVTA